MSMTLAHRAGRALGHLHGLRGRDRLLRLLFNPDRQRSRPFEAPFFGQTYPGDLASFIDWSVYFYGAYSGYELAALADAAARLKAARGRVTFYDVGANVGHHTLFVAPLVDQVHAFEPFPRVAAEIHRKIARNGLRNVTVHDLALSDRAGEAVFYPPDGANLGTGSLVAAEEGNRGEPITVTVARGDTALASLPRIDLLKIDVEGHEAAAFAGLAGRLRSDRPVILMEISGDDHSGFGTEAALRAALYPDAEIHEVRPHGRGYRLAPFDFAAAREVLVVPRELEGGAAKD